MSHHPAVTGEQGRMTRPVPGCLPLPTAHPDEDPDRELAA
jgi:hypothetical protein